MLKPKISRELYRCVVDGRFLFKRFHLSGILFFKQMDDGSTRAVFQNELGVAFFDFAWDTQDSFSVKSIMDALDRPAVVSTLRTDLNLLLMKGLAQDKESMIVYEGDTLSAFPVNSGTAWYRRTTGRLSGIEYWGKRSKVTSIRMAGWSDGQSLPLSVSFVHHKAHFSIELKKLSQDEQ
jgi:hypothetical protein